MKHKTKTCLLASLSFFFLFLPGFFALADFTYVPMEEIPGFDSTSSFPEYILVLYKFGLWTIGISGLLMITIGGFMYVTSGGNTSTIGKAKGIISDAIAGIILALLSYLLLYIINPSLVDGTDQAIEKAASEYGSVPEDDPAYGKYPVISSDLPKKCQTEIANGTFGATPDCLLVATAAIESGCDANINSTNGGKDCGMMQTRANVTGYCEYTCSELSSDAKKAVECAKNYMDKNYANANKTGRTSPEGQVLRDKYAAYNGGSGALDPSASCDSSMVNSYGNPYDKWDCPKECGGYCPVPARTSTFLNYYNQCNGGSSIE